VKAIILAAGIGKRLQPLTLSMPKSLIKIGGKEILGYQLDYLLNNGITNFVIATGLFHEKIERYIKDNYPDIRVTFVYNPIYEKTNYIYTLWLTRNYVNDDVLLLHGDLVFNKILLKKLVDFDKNGVLVSKKIRRSEKDFKAVISNERVVKIGVNLRGGNVYTCMPMYKLRKEDFLIWINKIEEFVNEGKTNLYAEDALNELTDKIEMYPVYFTNELCMEIDIREDIEKAEKAMENEKWTKK